MRQIAQPARRSSDPRSCPRRATGSPRCALQYAALSGPAAPAVTPAHTPPRRWPGRTPLRNCRPHPAPPGVPHHERRRSRSPFGRTLPSAAVICSGWVSHSRVEPSTSASSSVTVPVGSNSSQAPGQRRHLRVLAHGSQHRGHHPCKTSANARRYCITTRVLAQARRLASWTSCTREVMPSLA